VTGQDPRKICRERSRFSSFADDCFTAGSIMHQSFKKFEEMYTSVPYDIAVMDALNLELNTTFNSFSN
jgi:hypothetical protein